MIDEDVLAELVEAFLLFMAAFDNLDWDKFNDLIADDASIFMPWTAFQNRLDGIEKIESAFRPFFEGLPQTREGSP